MTDSTHQESGGHEGRLGLELAIVFAAQMVVVFSLVRLDDLINLSGALHAAVGLVFVFLPVIVLDRRGKPYARYGLRFSAREIPTDLAWFAGAAVICFAPLVFLSPLFWERAFEMGAMEWRFAWPDGYPEVAISHLLVVALPEEFFYRGYVMGRLDDIFPRRFKLLGARVGLSLPLQAVLFALGHFLVDLNPARLAVFFPALAFGWLRARRRSIVVPVLFHAASNIFMEILTTGYGFR